MAGDAIRCRVVEAEHGEVQGWAARRALGSVVRVAGMEIEIGHEAGGATATIDAVVKALDPDGVCW